MRALLTIILVSLFSISNGAIAAPAEGEGTTTPAATAATAAKAATAATATATSTGLSPLCLVEAWSVDRSWWGNRDLSITGPGALGAEWATAAVDDAGVVQHVIICGRPFRVLEENLLFSRVLWDSEWEENDRTSAARDRKIRVEANHLSHDTARQILGISAEEYVKELRKLSSRLDSVETSGDQPES